MRASIKKFLVIFLLSISTLFSFNEGFSIDLSHIVPDTSRSKTFLKNIILGQRLVIRNQHYAFLPDFFLICSSNGSQTSSKAMLGSEYIKSIDPKGTYPIYRNKNHSAVSFTGAESLKRFPVVLNLRTNTLAVVNGNILVQIKNKSDFAAIAAEYQLISGRYYDSVKLAVYRTDNLELMTEKLELLKKDARVLDVNMEVVENLYQPL